MKKAHNVRVKICGMTRFEDAIKAVELGADAVGFIFYKKSPRGVALAQAKTIIKELPPFVHRVGVFVNESAERIHSFVEKLGLDLVQLHGDESPADCRKIKARVLKAIRVEDSSSLKRLNQYQVDGFLLDTFHLDAYGGTGQVFDWKLAKQAGRFGRIIVAGGLNAGNVIEAIQKARPYGIDVCSGVEKTPGIKDHKKMRAFIDAARSANKE